MASDDRLDAAHHLIDELTAERDDLRRWLPPTAAEIVAAVGASDDPNADITAFQKWHPWPGGGGWGCPHSVDFTLLKQCPPDERQPGFRLPPTDNEVES